MKYIIVASDLVTTGGMDRANLAFASRAAEAGHDVEIVAHRVEQSLRNARGVAFHAAPRPFGSHTLGMPFLAAAARKRAKVPDRDRRLIANGGNCAVGDVNWVHYVHAADTTPRVGRRALLHGLHVKHERAAFERARVIIANSECTARAIIERCGIPRDRIRVVYYGCAQKPRVAAVSARAELNVLFVGPVHDARKGFDILLGAWREAARDRSWNARLWVVGANYQRSRTQQQLEAAGVADSVELLGFRHDVERLIGQAALLVAPSRYEPYGLAVHEALCAGVPAFVSAHAGIAERYPRELGRFLIPSSDPQEALTAMLQGWHRDEAAHRDAVAPFAELLRARSWDDMADEMIALTA